MRKFLLCCVAALSLSSCGLAPLLTGVSPAPVTVADKTVLDEQVAVTVELAYKAARLAVETGVEAGLIKGSLATKVAELDNRAFAAVTAVREAYKAGNANSYALAGADAVAAIRDMVSATRGSN